MRSTSGISCSTIVVDPAAVGSRERYEAVARSVRDVLSQRWVRTEKTYERENPKRVYYLSMEFLLGRSLANNIMNLLLDREVQHVVAEKGLDWLGVLEQEPDAGLGNGGLGRLAACFLDSMATMQLPAMGYGLRYEYGMFKQTIRDGWQREQPDNWLRQAGPVGSRPPVREGGHQDELRRRGARRDAATRHRPTVEPDRAALRSPGGRLRRQNDQHAAPVGGGGTRVLRLPGVQQR